MKAHIVTEPRYQKILGRILLLISALVLSGCKMAVLDPKGIIAYDEKNLLITAVLLMLIVVIPVIFLTVVISIYYRAGNTKSKYRPHWGHSTILEIIWWTLPCIIIAILAVITWTSSHQLDPYRPLDAKEKPLVIQVIALNWKWLFIYPEQNIATINMIQFPVNKPITFLITSDAPMNSFQIPRLGGQIYAMAGMQTKLHLMASEMGDYRGFSANYTGDGFYGMKFIARVSSQADFQKWVNTVKSVPHPLTSEEYNKLMKDSTNVPPEYYSEAKTNLYHDVMMKFMMPMGDTHSLENR
jgi:cytochrome o ubiquinol oxidase subunit 2